MYYTYVLIGLDGKRTYTGHTRSLKKRLELHNSGEVKSSKRNRPYKILIAESFNTVKEAKRRELYYKNYRGRQRIRKILTGNS